MNVVLKMMDFVSQMMNFVLKIMDFEGREEERHAICTGNSVDGATSNLQRNGI